MASRGLEAWKKHYKGKGKSKSSIPQNNTGSGYIKTRLKKDAQTYDRNNPQNKGPVIKAGQLVLVLPIENENEYKSYVRDPRFRSSNQANAFVPIKYGNKEYLCSFSALEKPDVRDLGVQTTNLLRISQTKQITILKKQNVSVYSFTNAEDIAAAVLSNIKKIHKLRDRYDFKDVINKYFTSDDPTKIEWTDSIQPLEKQQFAIYFGEIILGYALLKNRKDIIQGISPLQGLESEKKVVEVMFPISQSFRSIDSILNLKDGESICISSKAGVGMPGSLFANILFPMIESDDTIPKQDSVLKELCNVAKSFNTIRTAKARQIIYEYGIRNILGMGENEIKDTYKAYEEFKKFDKYEDYSDDVKRVYDRLKESMRGANNINAIRNLDESTTVFLCIEIAKKLNADDVSKEQMISFLKGKYYQANLDLGKLDAGEIQYKMISSGEANIKVIGNKSMYSNIDANQGLLNFQLS